MEMCNQSDAEFKMLVIRMPREFSEDLGSIKKIHSEMKALIYRETTGEWMKLIIKSMI